MPLPPLPPPPVDSTLVRKDGIVTPTWARWLRLLWDRIVLGTTPVAASYSSSSGQVIESGPYEVVDYATKLYDTHDAVTVGAAWRFTCPVAGYYLLTAMVSLASGSAIADFRLEASKNGTQLAAYAILGLTPASNFSICGSSVAYLEVGDYVDFQVVHQTGANRSLIPDPRYNHCTVTRIGG